MGGDAIAELIARPRRHVDNSALALTDHANQRRSSQPSHCCHPDGDQPLGEVRLHFCEWHEASETRVVHKQRQRGTVCDTFFKAPNLIQIGEIRYDDFDPNVMGILEFFRQFFEAIHGGGATRTRSCRSWARRSAKALPSPEEAPVTRARG